MSNQEISKSKQKRLAAEKARKEVKKKKNLIAFWSITIPLLILVLILFLVNYRKSHLPQYGKGLNANGCIDINTSEYASIDTTSMNFAKADIEPDSASVEADINSQLTAHQVISYDETLTITDGCRVKVAYTANLDGSVYAAASEEEGGFDMTIGYGALSEVVDEALIGQSIGKTVTVPVSYPDDYGVESLNGKTINYIVTVLGIYETAEFDDAFVQEYLYEDASTAAEYRQLIYDQYYDTNLESAIYNFIADSTVVIKYPEEYVDNQLKLMLDLNEKQFQSTKEMYASYGLNVEHVYKMYGYESEKDYKAQMRIDTETDIKYQLGVQLIYEQAGLSVSDEDVKTYFLTKEGYDETTYNDLLEEYGMPYLKNAVINQKVMEYLKETVVVK